MRHLTVYLIIIVFLSTTIIRGQGAIGDTPQLLENLYSRLLKSSYDNDRIQINDSIKSIIDSYVESDTVFTHRFDSLRYLGQITSPDSLLKIISWNLVLRNSPGRYFCYLIKRHEPGKDNSIYRLTATYSEDPVMTDTLYTEPDWYGALYYDIKPLVVNNKRLWILLGINYGNLMIARKIIDVLSFKNEDSPIFGKKWFDTGEEIRFRDVFEYAATGMMSLRFNSDSSIVFDHLVPFSPAQSRDRQFYGPDYSSDAYNLKDGLWKLTINVDARNTE